MTSTERGPGSSFGVDTDEQAALRSSLRDLVARHGGPEAVRAAGTTADGFDPALWSMLVEQVGAAALSIPERFDGAGATWVEAHIAAEELGRGLVPSPFLGSAVFAAQAVLATGDPGTRERLLPRIASGEIVSLCWAGDDGWSVPGCTAEGSVVSGTATAVLDGHAAQTLLVLAVEGDGVVLVEVSAAAPGVTVTRVPAMDPTRPLATVRFDRAEGIRIPTRNSFLSRLRAVCWTAITAEQIGAMTRALEATVEYTGQRKQFGRVIGSFQALKHRMADMYVLAETSRSVSYSAAARVADMLAADTGEGGGDGGDGGDAASDDLAHAAEIEAAAAKVYCSESFMSVAGEMIQLHGGIGITWEHDAQLIFKRAHGTAQLLGQPHELLAALEPAAGL